MNIHVDGSTLPTALPVGKPSLRLTGMFGVGDCLHQRAVLRELMRRHDVTLQSYFRAMYHDLEAEGLKLVASSRPNMIRMRELAPRLPAAPRGFSGRRFGYTPATIKQAGSILAAQFAEAGLKMPERPDFRLLVPAAWRKLARARLAGKNPAGKPLLVYRPLVLNDVWRCEPRLPEPNGYAALFASLRERFFVISVADLNLRAKEWLVGPPASVDVEFHKGELFFEEMAGLFAEAKLIFANPGFVPVLAQAVGTPVVIVYGGNESFRTTNSVGAHLVPTLAIEPLPPCECHDRECKRGCTKEIDLVSAKARLSEFVAAHCQSQSPQATATKTLIFATTYVDTPERLKQTQQWIAANKMLNPDCDHLIVDSQSPLLWQEDGAARSECQNDVEIFSFPDNIGHLSRNGPNGPSSRGQDGWGRAFCHGLQAAIDGGYDYVVHIEGDSLFKLPVMPIVQQMACDGVKAMSTPVEGTRRKEIGWVETGLMFLSTRYLKESNFIARYDWPSRKRYPTTPEVVIAQLLGKDLKMMPWRAERGDKSQITVDNVTELDWVTHCRDPKIYDRFMEAILQDVVAPADESLSRNLIAGPIEFDQSVIDLDASIREDNDGARIDDTTSAPPSEMIKLNFGCGTNKLDGWQNHDADINITKRLPFPDNHADCIYAEHCVEHVDYATALKFLAQCARVLKPGGVIRVSVPSIENICKRADQAYCDFVHERKWAPTADVRGAMHAILHCHGHKAPWTQSLLEASLVYAGFRNPVACEQHESTREHLRNVEGHHRVIGERMNWIESAIAEAEKANVDYVHLTTRTRVDK